MPGQNCSWTASGQRGWPMAAALAVLCRGRVVPAVRVADRALQDRALGSDVSRAGDTAASRAGRPPEEHTASPPRPEPVTARVTKIVVYRGPWIRTVAFCMRPVPSEPCDTAAPARGRRLDALHLHLHLGGGDRFHTDASATSYPAPGLKRTWRRAQCLRPCHTRLSCARPVSGSERQRRRRSL